jgi:hypothetical protein
LNERDAFLVENQQDYGEPPLFREVAEGFLDRLLEMLRVFCVSAARFDFSKIKDAALEPSP